MSSVLSSSALSFGRRSVTSLPLATRTIALVTAIAIIPTIMPLEWANENIVHAAAMCAGQLQSSASPLLQLHRFLLSPLVHTDFLSGLISLFAIIQVGQRIETQKGTIAFMQLFLILFLLTQSIHLLFVSYTLTQTHLLQMGRQFDINLEANDYDDNLRIPIWGAHPSALVGQSAYTWKSLFSFSIPTQACSVNNWAIIFGLIVYECQALAKEFTRFVFLIPVGIPTRLVPLVLFLSYQFWFGVQLHTFIGFGLGYVITFAPFLLLPPWILRTAEFHLCTKYESFVSVDKAGKMQPYRQYIIEEQQQQESMNGNHDTLTNNINNANSINAPTNLNRASVPVHRASRPSSDHWRRVDVSSSDSSGGSSSSTDADADGEEVASAAAGASASGPRSSTKTNSATTPRGTNGGMQRPNNNTNDQTVILAENVARILEPAYPMDASARLDTATIVRTQE